MKTPPTRFPPLHLAPRGEERSPRIPATEFLAGVPWPRFAPPSPGLARPIAPTPHDEPRSLRNFAQYSSRFLISRSNPRSGGS